MSEKKKMLVIGEELVTVRFIGYHLNEIIVTRLLKSDLKVKLILTKVYIYFTKNILTLGELCC